MSLSGLLLACANKNGDTVRYAERRQDKGETRQKACSYRCLLVAHRLRPSHRVSQKYFASLIRPTGEPEDNMKIELRADQMDPDSDWVGNIAAFRCAECSQVFIVSALLHPKGRF